jgi:hypothetical protein
MDGEIMADQWEEAAKEFNAQPSAKPVGAPAPTSDNEDWKLWQQNAPAPSEQPYGGLKEFMTSPHGLLRTGLSQAGKGVKELLTSGQRMSGASDLMEGVGRFATPFALPFAAAAPVAAGTAALAGYGGQKLGEAAARALGAGPEARRLTGDLVAVPTSVFGGVGGGVLSRAAAPLAESALGIRGTARAYGATPGKAILNETSGIRPSAVEQSARGKIRVLGQELESRAAGSTQPGSLDPARSIVANDIGKAASRNSISTPNELAPLQRFLREPAPGFTGATEYPNGANTPISFQPTQSSVLGPNGQPVAGAPNIVRGAAPPLSVAQEQPASSLLGMRRQLDTDFIRNWNPAASTKGALGTARRTYGALSKELDRVVPGASELDQRISSLVPVAERARLTDLNAGPGERILNRVARPTGGLLPLIFGYHEGGPLGALGTVLGQEALSSPTTKMLGARGLHVLGQPLSAAPSVVLGQRRTQ